MKRIVALLTLILLMGSAVVAGPSAGRTEVNSVAYKGADFDSLFLRESWNWRSVCIPIGFNPYVWDCDTVISDYKLDTLAIFYPGG